MVKNDIWLEDERKQNTLFLKIFVPKNASMLLMSRIGPACLSCDLPKKVHVIYTKSLF